jgi:hypothetical protein
MSAGAPGAGRSKTSSCTTRPTAGRWAKNPTRPHPALPTVPSTRPRARPPAVVDRPRDGHAVVGPDGAPPKPVDALKPGSALSLERREGVEMGEGTGQTALARVASRVALDLDPPS